MNELVELKPKIVEKMLDDNIVMIDIRRRNEWETTGIIRNSYLLTFFDDNGNYDINKWMNEFSKLVTNKKQTFILICARANRTRVLGNFLLEQGYKNTSHLQGGIYQWIREGKPTIKP